MGTPKLEVRSSPATGNVLLFDTSLVLVTFLGALDIGGSGSASSGTITHAKFGLGSGIFAYVLMRTTSVYAGDIQPTLTINSSSIDWSYPAASHPEATILYGIK